MRVNANSFAITLRLCPTAQPTCELLGGRHIRIADDRAGFEAANPYFSEP